MRIGVLAHTRRPTLPRGGDGAGRMAWDIAAGLARRGHNAVLYGGPGSEAPDAVRLAIYDDETGRAEWLIPGNDAWLDLSHFHGLARLHPDWPVVNWLVDTECRYQPPCAVVGNAWQRRAFPAARIVPLGIDVDAVPLIERKVPGLGRFSKEPYLAFCHKLHPLKGVDLAAQVGDKAKVAVHYAGELFVTPAPANWHGELTDDALLWEFLGCAEGLLSPARRDAGGRVNLEAAACGTPVLTLAGTGTACHVEHCVSGFVCADVDELADAVQDLPRLDRRAMRAWVRETHDVSVMLDQLESLLTEAADGGTW